MPRYAVAGDKGTASVRTIIAVMATTTVRRVKVYDYIVGNEDTPADNVFIHQILRQTSDPIGASVTPEPLDEADAAAVAVGLDTITADGIIGAPPLMQFALNARATFRWVAAPGSEFVGPATDNSGLTGAIELAATADFSAPILYEE